MILYSHWWLVVVKLSIYKKCRAMPLIIPKCQPIPCSMQVVTSHHHHPENATQERRKDKIPSPPYPKPNAHPTAHPCKCSIASPHLPLSSHHPSTTPMCHRNCPHSAPPAPAVPRYSSPYSHSPSCSSHKATHYCFHHAHAPYSADSSLSLDSPGHSYQRMRTDRRRTRGLRDYSGSSAPRT